MHRDAIISDCGAYRYLLRRSWGTSRPYCTFVMLNPSTADAEQDDQTIRKCIGFADRLGFDGFAVVNLFAYRATDPKDLRRAGYPVGDENDFWINLACRETVTTICAWGANARGLARPTGVLSVIRAARRTPMALRLTADGIPCHPLMLPYTCTLSPAPAATEDTP